MKKFKAFLLSLAAAGALVGATVVSPVQAHAAEQVNCLSSPDPLMVIRGSGSPGQGVCIGGSGKYGFTGGYPDVTQILTGDYSGWITYIDGAGRGITFEFKPQDTINFDQKGHELLTVELN